MISRVISSFSWSSTAQQKYRLAYLERKQSKRLFILRALKTPGPDKDDIVTGTRYTGSYFDITNPAIIQCIFRVGLTRDTNRTPLSHYTKSRSCGFGAIITSCRQFLSLSTPESYTFWVCEPTPSGWPHGRSSSFASRTAPHTTSAGAACPADWTAAWTASIGEKIRHEESSCVRRVGVCISKESLLFNITTLIRVN